MRTKLENNQLTIEAYGIIGEDITAAAVAEALDAAGDIGGIVCRVNSPGGSVWDGAAIYSRLVEHPAPVTTVVDGIALSAASFIVQAGDTRRMAEAATMMVHCAWSIVVGNKADMAKAGDMLGKFDETIASIYAARSGMSPSEASAMMDAETWFTSAEALDQGFVDEVLPLKAADNLWDLSCYSRVPRNVKNGSTPWQATVARARDLSITMPELHVAAMAQPLSRKETFRMSTPSTPQNWLTSGLDSDPIVRDEPAPPQAFDEARVRREYRDAGGEKVIGVTEELYLKSARIDAGLEPLLPIR